MGGRIMSVSFHKLTANVGAEVQGFEIRDIDRTECAKALRNALSEYNLLKLHLPDFSTDEQIELASLFGRITMRGSYGRDPGNRLTEYVSNVRTDGTLGNGPFHFHHDHLFYQQPLSTLVLYAVEIPDSGSITKFRDAHHFYQGLPEETKAKLQGIDVLHMMDFRTDSQGNTHRHLDRDGGQSNPPPSCWRPFVSTNPRTGRSQVRLSPAVEDFRGVSKAEGFEILRELLRIGRYEDDPNSTYVHEWKVGDLIIWDNLALGHARAPFDSSQPRTLRRTPII